MGCFRVGGGCRAAVAGLGQAAPSEVREGGVGGRLCAAVAVAAGTGKRAVRGGVGGCRPVDARR